ncbi:sulfatase-like hydrolase/transferase, partial [bacterium]|nr:sulfatase-like hydrolase/transferase [bacterium]
MSYSQEVDGEKRYVTTVMEEKAISFMRETPEDQPFLLIMALPEPHGQTGPWNYRDPEFELEPPPGPPAWPETMTEEAHDRLPRAILESQNNASGKCYRPGEKYMATVRDYTARADRALGRIRNALRELHIEDNTVIIFTSDNGTTYGAHGISQKWNMYEESIRVPLTIYDPRLPTTSQGSREQMGLNIDLGPTMLALAGLEISSVMQGTDLSPILRDADSKGREDWFYDHDLGDYLNLPRCQGVRTGRWKYIHYTATDEEELFDLAADPLEMNNLASDPDHASTLAKLRQRCNELREAAK